VGKLIITGLVLSGFGKGGGFVALEWVRREIRQKFGFEPYPGTLNLKVSDPQSRKNLELARSMSPITIDPPTADFCSAQGARASVAGLAAAIPRSYGPRGDDPGGGGAPSLAQRLGTAGWRSRSRRGRHCGLPSSSVRGQIPLTFQEVEDTLRPAEFPSVFPAKRNRGGRNGV